MKPSATHNIIEIASLSDERVSVYAQLRDGNLRHHIASQTGIFIAESPKVIRVALEAGYKPLSLLCEARHIYGDCKDIIDDIGYDTPIYTGSRDILAKLTGYTLTRGVLCAMERRPLPTVSDVVGGKHRIAVLDGVCESTNTGSIFRAAAALGIDGILLSRTSCDPLNRRSIRVSMGAVFRIPWTWIDSPFDELHKFGYKTLAMALKPTSIPLDSEELKDIPQIAIILGTEGDGLSDNVIHQADYSVIIPMHHNIDSLNVASAAAVTFWQLRKRH